MYKLFSTYCFNCIPLMLYHIYIYVPAGGKTKPSLYACQKRYLRSKLFISTNSFSQGYLCSIIYTKDCHSNVVLKGYNDCEPTRGS